MSTRLRDTRGSDVIFAFVDGVLHLLQELIDVKQIVLGPHVGHRRQLVLNRLRAAITRTTTATAGSYGHWGRHGLVFRDRSTAQDGKLQVLQAQKALADRSVRVGVKLAALQVTKEFIERIIPALLRLVRDMSRVLALIEGVVNIAVRWVRGLCWVRVVVLRRPVSIALGGDGVQCRLEVMSTGSISCSHDGASQPQSNGCKQSTLG